MRGHSAVNQVHAKPACCQLACNRNACLNRTDGSAARERYARYGGGLFPVAWYDLQRFWAGHLPEGALRIGAAFERYEEGADGVTVRLKARPPPAAVRSVDAA